MIRLKFNYKKFILMITKMTTKHNSIWILRIKKSFSIFLRPFSRNLIKLSSILWIKPSNFLLQRIIRIRIIDQMLYYPQNPCYRIDRRPIQKHIQTQSSIIIYIWMIDLCCKLYLRCHEGIIVWKKNI